MTQEGSIGCPRPQRYFGVWVGWVLREVLADDFTRVLLLEPHRHSYLIFLNSQLIYQQRLLFH